MTEIKLEDTIYDEKVNSIISEIEDDITENISNQSYDIWNSVFEDDPKMEDLEIELESCNNHLDSLSENLQENWADIKGSIETFMDLFQQQQELEILKMNIEQEIQDYSEE